MAALTPPAGPSPTALVVGVDGKVQLRALTTDRAIGNDWLITNGLKDGDRLIVSGVQMVRPGVEVTANEVTLNDTSAAPIVQFENIILIEVKDPNVP